MRHQPVGQHLQAADRSAARRRRTSAGATTTAPRWSGCRCTSPTRASRPASSCAPSTPPCNPYLAYAVMLAAGMKGIEEGYELPARGRGRRLVAHRARAQEPRHRAAAQEPATTRSAIAEDSELLAETLGEHVFDFFLRNKRAEWEEYRGQVSAFERDRMLPGRYEPRRPPTSRPGSGRAAHDPAAWWSLVRRRVSWPCYAAVRCLGEHATIAVAWCVLVVVRRGAAARAAADARVAARSAGRRRRRLSPATHRPAVAVPRRRLLLSRTGLGLSARGSAGASCCCSSRRAARPADARPDEPGDG